MRRRSLSRSTRRIHLISSDGLLNVLHLLSTKVHKGNRQDLAYLVVRRSRDTHATRLRNRLQPRGNVHTITEEVSTAYHHVTDVDTDAEAYPAIRCETGVRFKQGGLRLNGALHGVHGTSELRKDPVARRVRYAAPVVPNEPVEDRAPFRQPLERADLVSAHEAAVALHIRCEDGNELP